jgi:Fe-S-cluster containining protein
MKLKHQLPSFYENILPARVLQLDVVETKATCEDCAMARPRQRGKIHYRPDLKCCTFHPFLPNFLVGAILSDPSLAAGAEVLREKIRRREYALPVGMVAPVRYQLEFKARKENEFGQREDWLCPYYNKEKNLCNVWRFRGVVCTTFFCKSSYGKEGLRFWDRASDYLSYVEMALLEEALVNLDFSPRQINSLLEYLNRESGSAAEKRSWVLPSAKFTELWNGYADDIEGFYKKTFQIARNLDKKSFSELAGEMGKNLEENLLAQYAQL